LRGLLLREGKGKQEGTGKKEKERGVRNEGKEKRREGKQ